MTDKRLLPDVVTVTLYGELDAYGKPTVAETLTIKNCHLDRGGGDAGTDNNKSRSRQTVLIFFPRYTKATVTDAWIGGTVVDADGNRYTIQRWEDNKLNGRVFSYELELK